MKISSSTRKQQLVQLQKALVILCDLLRLDKSTYWLVHFERCLKTTDDLLVNGFDQPALNEHSLSVRSVYGGMGSFNDYMPVMHTKESSVWYHKHGEPERIFQIVYNSAFNLMVVDEHND